MSINKLSVISSFFFAAAIVFFAQAAAAGSQTLEGDIYTIKINTKAGVATITITPKVVGGVKHHCNMEFPWKLEIEQTEGVTTDLAKYEAPYKSATGEIHSPAHTKEFKEEKVVWQVKYTVQAGKKVKGKLTISVCDPKQCYRKTHQIEWE